MNRQRKEPGPDHPIAITPFDGRVRVIWNGEVVADTVQARQLVETTYPPALYIPRADVRADVLRASGTKTWCPYKGEASYLSLESGGKRSPDAIWVYEVRGGRCHRGPSGLLPEPGRADRTHARRMRAGGGCPRRRLHYSLT